MFKSKLSRNLLVTTIFIFNTIVVLFFARDKLPLPQNLVSLFNQVETRIAPELTPNDIRSDSGITQTDNLYAQHKLHEYNLKTEEFAEVKTSCNMHERKLSNAPIYAWIDEKGLQHISDKPPTTSDSINLDVVGQIKPETIDINYKGNHVSDSFKASLTTNITKILSLYATLLDKSTIKPVTIQFHIFTSHIKYKKYRDQVSPSLKGMGFFIGSKNEAVMYVSNEVDALETATHEAVHAINRQFFGRMPKWLNEGLAEYAEHYVQGKKHHKSWPQVLASQGNKISPKVLFNTNKEEWNGQNSHLYANSWALVYGLMQSSSEMDKLKRYMFIEAQNGCEAMDAKIAESIYYGLSSSLLLKNQAL